MKILIGTHNKAKQEDLMRSIQAAAEQNHIQVEFVLPEDLGITDDVEETGSTFEENSLIKAEFFYKVSGIPTIADDGGIMIPALNNEPGVRTRRWTGNDKASDQELIDFTLEKMKDLNTNEERTAFFQTCATYYDGTLLLQESGKNKCVVAKVPLQRNKTPGFPFRSLMILQNGKFYDDLTEEEHRMYNHRDIAVYKLVEKLTEHVGH